MECYYMFGQAKLKGSTKDKIEITLSGDSMLKAYDGIKE